MCIDDCFTTILLFSIGIVLFGAIVATVLANVIERIIHKFDK